MVRPDPDVLQRWVIDEGVPPASVGKRLGLSRAAGYSWLRRYGITAVGPAVEQGRLVALWRAGLVADQLAAEVGLPPDAIRERLVSASVLTPSRSYFVVGSPADPLPESLLRDWYAREGFTVAQVAELTGTTPRQVRYRLARYRLSPGRPGPAVRARRSLTKAALTELYLVQRMTTPQIAARAGVSTETVRELLVEYGIDRRRGGARGPDLAVQLAYLTPTAPKIDASTGVACSSSSGKGRHSLTATTPGSTNSRPAKNSSNSARVRG